MSLTLYAHPFAAYCWKALIALYESETPFTYRIVEDAAGWAELEALWKRPDVRRRGNDPIAAGLSPGRGAAGVLGMRSSRRCGDACSLFCAESCSLFCTEPCGCLV